VKTLKTIWKILVGYKNFSLLQLGLLTSKKKRVGKERMDICIPCKLFDKDTKKCIHCGCPMEKKTLVMEEKCPKGKWFAK
jgi:hypothetical protein